MVLSNASSAPPEASFNDAPADSVDPYDSNSMNNNGVNATFQSLPQPCPGTQLFGFTNEKLSTLINIRMRHAERMMHRPPNQAEATALAYWAAKQYSIISYAYPVGIAAGLWRTYGTRKTWKFPFLKPDLTKFNPDVFPTEKIKLFSGQRARAAWNGIRLTAYTSGFVFAAQILFASYGMSVVAVGEQTDKRLNEYIEAVKKTAGQAHTAMQQRRGQQLPPPVPGPGGQQQQQPYGFGVPPVAAQKQQEEYDDASPTGGKAFWEENDNDLAEKGWKSETDPSRERFESRVERDSEKRRRRMGGDINAGTSGVSDSSAYSEENSDPSSGSAWERLRRQNGPSGGSQYGDRND